MKFNDAYMFQTQTQTYDDMVESFSSMSNNKLVVDVYQQVVSTEKHPYLNRDDTWWQIEDELLGEGKIKFDNKIHDYADIEYRRISRALILKSGGNYLDGFVAPFYEVPEDVKVLSYRMNFQGGRTQDRMENRLAGQTLLEAIENKRSCLFARLDEDLTALNGLKAQVDESEIYVY